MSIIQICEYYSALPSTPSYHYSHTKAIQKAAKEPYQNVQSGSRTYNPSHQQPDALPIGLWIRVMISCWQCCIPVPAPNASASNFNTTTAIKGKFPPLQDIPTNRCAHFTWSDVESLFSLAKILTHWNMRPGSLRVLTLPKGCIVFEPTIDDIWSAYKDKYGVHDGVDLTSSSEEEIESSEDESEWGQSKLTFVYHCVISNNVHHLFTIVLLNRKCIIPNTICICE